MHIHICLDFQVWNERVAAKQSSDDFFLVYFILKGLNHNYWRTQSIWRRDFNSKQILYTGKVLTKTRMKQNTNHPSPASSFGEDILINCKHTHFFLCGRQWLIFSANNQVRSILATEILLLLKTPAPPLYRPIQRHHIQHVTLYRHNCSYPIKLPLCSALDPVVRWCQTKIFFANIHVHR